MRDSPHKQTGNYAAKRLGTTTVLQSTSVDVRDGSRFDSERTSETGRSLMDAAELRQMVKYKQAVAIISNAPPVRLSYPPFARQTRPPLAMRELCFQRGSQSAEALPSVEMAALLINHQASPRPNAQWAQATQAIQPKRSSEPLRFEPENEGNATQSRIQQAESDLRFAGRGCNAGSWQLRLASLCALSSLAT